MLPTHFPGCNRRFEKPGSMKDEECSALDAFVFKDESTDTVITRTYWMPSKEDIEAIVAGRGIVLDILLSGGMPPVSLWTLDENGNIN